MTSAYRVDRAPVVAAASYTSVLLSLIYGYLFWKEVPHPLAWLGGGLIVFGGLMLLRARIHVREPPSPAAT
jgi:drug/metabolite transporter (DMT)-like permease